MRFTILLFAFCLGLPILLPAQSNPSAAPAPVTAGGADTWTIDAGNIDPTNYYGVTIANGMIGLVSSTEPFRVKDIVLNGAFDLYGRGRVGNILKTFNFVNL